MFTNIPICLFYVLFTPSWLLYYPIPTRILITILQNEKFTERWRRYQNYSSYSTEHIVFLLSRRIIRNHVLFCCIISCLILIKPESILCHCSKGVYSDFLCLVNKAENRKKKSNCYGLRGIDLLWCTNTTLNIICISMSLNGALHNIRLWIPPLARFTKHSSV